MIITRLFGCLVYLCVAAHILAGCHGREMQSTTTVPQQSSFKRMDDVEVEINQKKHPKNRRRMRRHRTTEAPESSNESSSTDTDVSKDEDGSEPASSAPANRKVRPVAPKTIKPKATQVTPANVSSSTSPRQESPPPPPPIANLLDGEKPHPVFPKFPISPDQLLSGKGRLRKIDPKNARMKRKPKTPQVGMDGLDMEPPAVDVE